MFSFFHGGNLFIQQIRTLGKGLEEACFLHIDDLVNEFLLFHELRVMLTIHGNDLIGKGGKELAPNAKETSMTDGTAQNAAQDDRPLPSLEGRIPSPIMKVKLRA